MSARYRAAAFAAAAVFLAACGRPAPAPASASRSPPLAAIEVAVRDVPRERVWDGTVQATNQAVLSAQTAGRVLELPFDVNDYVAKDAVVVRFTDVEQGAGLRAAQAQLRSAEATYRETQAQYERLASVYAQKYVARAQFDQQVAARDAAKAAVDAAQAAVRQASQATDYTVVRAPYSGYVTRRYVQVGETVQPGQPLIAGLSLDPLRVETQVPQTDIKAIREHHRAWLLRDDGARVEAAKVVVFPYADPATHSFTVRLELPQGQVELNPGEVVRVAFQIGSRAVVAVPEGALVRRGEIVGVYVVDGDRPLLRQVRLGDRTADGLEVLAGLRPGEKIAADAVAALGRISGQSAAGERAHE